MGNKSVETGARSLGEIAEEAGCSKMTVSRVLRGERHVAAATAERVRAAAERLGYRENPLVQTLMATVRRRRVAVAANLAWLTPPKPHRVAPWVLLRSGAEARARELGFGLEDVVWEEGMSEARMLGVLRARGICGVVLAPLRRAGERPVFPWAAFPMAAIGRSVAEPLLHHVMHHYYHATERVLEEVTRRGYQRVALLTRADVMNRSDSAQEMVFLHFNRGRPAKWRIEPACCDEWGAREMAAWLGRARPEAVVASYPEVLVALRAGGAEVPGEMGFAALSWREQHPDTAGWRHPFPALGAAAVDMVVAQIHRSERGVPARPKCMLLEGDWVDGATLPERGKKVC